MNSASSKYKWTLYVFGVFDFNKQIVITLIKKKIMYVIGLKNVWRKNVERKNEINF